MDIVASLKLDTAEFEQSIPAVSTALKALEAAASGSGRAAAQTQATIGSTSGAAASTAPAIEQLNKAVDGMAQSMEKAAEALSKAAAGIAAAGASAKAGASKMAGASQNAVQGLGAVNATTSLLTGSLQSTAGAGVGLAGALKGLGLAAAGPVALTAAIAVGLTKAIGGAIIKARELSASIKFDNARMGIENMRQAFARLAEVSQRNIDLQRELRGVTAEGAAVEVERQLAELELRRKQALAGGGDANEINKRFDSDRSRIEFGGRTAANTEQAAEARRQKAENDRLIAENRASIDEITNKAANATRSAAAYASEASGFGLGRPENLKRAQQYNEQAKGLVEQAAALRSQNEELEKKNTVLDAQIGIYEKRNEVVELERRAAGINLPEDAGTKVGAASAAEPRDDRSPLAVAVDSLARIGGYVGGAGAAPKMETMTQKIMENTRRTNDLLARNAMRSPVAAWG